MIRVDHLPPLPASPSRNPAHPPRPVSRWAVFWDDRQAAALKIILLVLSVVAIAMLEAPR